MNYIPTNIAMADEGKFYFGAAPTKKQQARMREMNPNHAPAMALAVTLGPMRAMKNMRFFGRRLLQSPTVQHYDRYVEEEERLSDLIPDYKERLSNIRENGFSPPEYKEFDAYVQSKDTFINRIMHSLKSLGDIHEPPTASNDNPPLLALPPIPSDTTRPWTSGPQPPNRISNFLSSASSVINRGISGIKSFGRELFRRPVTVEEEVSDFLPRPTTKSTYVHGIGEVIDGDVLDAPSIDDDVHSFRDTGLPTNSDINFQRSFIGRAIGAIKSFGSAALKGLTDPAMLAWITSKLPIAGAVVLGVGVIAGIAALAYKLYFSKSGEQRSTLSPEAVKNTFADLWDEMKKIAPKYTARNPAEVQRRIEATLAVDPRDFVRNVAALREYMLAVEKSGGGIGRSGRSARVHTTLWGGRILGHGRAHCTPKSSRNGRGISVY